MSNLDPEQIRLYRWADQLPAALWDDLRRRDPTEAAQATGAELVDGGYRLALLGRTYRLEPEVARLWEEDRPDHRVGYQTGMVLVTTLAHSLGVPPAGRMVTPQELPGGNLFFQGPHALPTAALEDAFGARPQRLVERARALGGEETGGADVAVRVPALPMVPMYVLLWRGDSEFPPRAVIGLDARAHFHLALDGIWALCNLLVRRLRGEDHA
jgi:hypothetical protein